MSEQKMKEARQIVDHRVQQLCHDIFYYTDFMTDEKAAWILKRLRERVNTITVRDINPKNDE